MNNWKGKGSWQRERDISLEEWQRNWDKIFGREEEIQEDEDSEEQN